jgi:type IV pilus biogenesis protein CpaD/CtpE
MEMKSLVLLVLVVGSLTACKAQPSAGPEVVAHVETSTAAKPAKSKYKRIEMVPLTAEQLGLGHSKK